MKRSNHLSAPQRRWAAWLALCLIAIGWCISASAARGAEGPTGQHLLAGDYLAVVGDSITEQKQYSVFIEDYLLMCKPEADLRATQFGWSGDTSWGFAGRMQNDMLRFHCTAATTCFGMNDGGYSPMDDAKAKHYHDAQTSVVEQMKKGGVRFIVVGSPGCVDSDSYHKSAEQAAMYNKTLAAERDIARKVAEEQGVAFADVYDPMVMVMEKAKAKYGHDYHIAGGDGVHPDANGHLVMAYAFLKALGCNGDIGTITVDLAAGTAQGSEGHKVLGVREGNVEVQSSKYPFCFFGDPKSTGSTRGVIEFLPFNEELNRFKLVVTNPKAERVRVTWGKEGKDFPAAQLAQGINLAAEFPENAFAEAFKRVEDEVRKQQGYETPLVKQALHDLPVYREMAPEESAALDRIADAGVKKDKALVEASSAAAAKPVRHTIRVEAIK